MKRALILTKYHLASLWNWRSIYLSRIIDPLAYFIFLVAGIAGMISSSFKNDYTQYALTGIFCLLAFRIFITSVSDVSNDRKWGVYAIFTMQGGTTSAYLASVVAVSTLMFLAQVATLLLAYFIFYSGAFTVDTFTTIALSVSMAVLVVWGWSGLGAAIGALVNNYAKRDMIATLTSLTVVLSAPLFYTLDSVPAYLKAIALVNPLTYQVDWIRNPTLPSLSIATFWVLAAYIIGSFALKKADRVSSER